MARAKSVIKLKSCPFCGREVEIRQYIAGEDNMNWIEHKQIEPICFLSFARGYIGKKDDLIELWNTRSESK